MITQNEIRHFLDFTKDLACSGGRLAKSLLGKTTSSLKADKSIVTEADHRVQDMLVERLAREFPFHGLIAEENTQLTMRRPKANEGFVWVIDPIDGTRNFAAGVCLFSCSVALMYQGRPITAAIYEPNFDWLFSAGDQLPAQCNGQTVKVRSGKLNLETVIGISINTHAHRPPILHHLLDRCMVRNLGSTALHLGMVGAGLIDGMIHFGGKLWDIAAGALIVQQAGGEILSITPDGKATNNQLWPMNLGQYRNEPLPFMAANPDLLTDFNSIQ